jgi:hypothetical protein
MSLSPQESCLIKTSTKLKNLKEYGLANIPSSLILEWSTLWSSLLTSSSNSGWATPVILDYYWAMEGIPCFDLQCNNDCMWLHLPRARLRLDTKPSAATRPEYIMVSNFHSWRLGYIYSPSCFGTWQIPFPPEKRSRPPHHNGRVQELHVTHLWSYALLDFFLPHLFTHQFCNLPLPHITSLPIPGYLHPSATTANRLPRLIASFRGLAPTTIPTNIPPEWMNVTIMPGEANSSKAYWWYSDRHWI